MRRAPLALLVLLPAIHVGCTCSRGDRSGASASASESISASVPAPSSAVDDASPTARPVPSRVCRVVGAAAAPVSGGGAPAITHGIAARGDDVVVTWGELRKGGADFPDGERQRFEMARLVDGRTLTPSGPPRILGSQDAVDAYSNGIAPYAPAAGALGTATCAWVAFAGKLECSVAALERVDAGVADAGGAARAWTDAVAGPGPAKDRIAAAAVDDGVLLLLPQCQELRVYASRAKRTGLLVAGSSDMLMGCDPKRDVDAPAIVAAGDHGAVAAWRRVGTIEVRHLHADGTADGPRAQASAPGDEVGAPAIAWGHGLSAVAFAARRGAAPYTIQVATWSGGGGVPVHAPLGAGPTSAVAPAIAPTEDAACWMLSWTEGAGHATRVRAGLVCGGALVSSSVVDVSPPDVEAGDSELAAAGASSAFVAWQAMPKGQPSEIRLARIACE